ncbi:MAG: ExbD/TolR family protein [Cucumibacter sp.]
MAIAVDGKRAGARRRGRRFEPMSQINVTPMVDVMLVLLIVFMVAAPLLTVGVPIDLPETQARPLNAESKPVTISVTSDGRVYLMEEVVPTGELVARLGEIAIEGIDERIYVRGDTSAQYGIVMQVMGLLAAAGYTHIGLITEQAPPE